MEPFLENQDDKTLSDFFKENDKRILQAVIEHNKTSQPDNDLDACVKNVINSVTAHSSYSPKESIEMIATAQQYASDIKSLADPMSSKERIENHKKYQTNITTFMANKLHKNTVSQVAGSFLALAGAGLIIGGFFLPPPVSFGIMGWGAALLVGGVTLCVVAARKSKPESDLKDLRQKGFGFFNNQTSAPAPLADEKPHHKP